MEKLSDEIKEKYIGIPLNSESVIKKDGKVVYHIYEEGVLSIQLRKDKSYDGTRTISVYYDYNWEPARVIGYMPIKLKIDGTKQMFEFFLVNIVIRKVLIIKLIAKNVI